MKSRSEKLKRLVNVQRHMEQMVEADLAAATRQRVEVSETLDIVTEAIGSLNPVHCLFTGIYSVQFGRLQQQDMMLAGLQQMHETRLLKERTKGDRLEENMKDARTLEEREAEDNSIYDLMDQRIASTLPASGKLQGS